MLMRGEKAKGFVCSCVWISMSEGVYGQVMGIRSQSLYSISIKDFVQSFAALDKSIFAMMKRKRKTSTSHKVKFMTVT